eukprot:5888-Heterococcus_DN1.PRE.1
MCYGHLVRVCLSLVVALHILRYCSEKSVLKRNTHIVHVQPDSSSSSDNKLTLVVITEWCKIGVHTWLFVRCVKCAVIMKDAIKVAAVTTAAHNNSIGLLTNAHLHRHMLLQHATHHSISLL